MGRFRHFSVQSKCSRLLHWSQSTQSTFLPFLPFVDGPSFPQTLQWLVLPFLFGTVFHAMVDCLFLSLITTISYLLLLLRRCWFLETKCCNTFNWFISSYSLNWLANISFVWTTDECSTKLRLNFFPWISRVSPLDRSFEDFWQNHRGWI